MEIIKNYIITLTSFIFIAAMFKNFLPDGSIKKSVTSVLAVIMSALVIFPVLKINSADLDIFTDSEEYNIYSERINSMQELQNTQTRRLFSIQLTKAVEHILESYGEDKRAEVILNDDNTVNQVVIYTENPEISAEITRSLGITAAQISTRR